MTISARRLPITPNPPREIGDQILWANDLGVVGDGVIMNTAALQRAIDQAAAARATLAFRPGVYVTGSVFLKSGMAMRIDRDVRITGAQALADYEQRPTRIAGIEMTWPSALINIYGESDVRLHGEGVIDGDGRVFWEIWKRLRDEYQPHGLRWAADYDAQRPRLIQIYNSSRVEIGGGLTLTRSGFWTLQVVYSEQVKISGIKVRNNVDGKGPSTDGVDIDSSRHVLVEHADIDNNDDAICLKCGRDSDGLRVNLPTEHVLIRNCIVRNAIAGITFGSETSGGMRHIEVHDIDVQGPVLHGVLFKSAATRGGVLSDIHLHDISVDGARYGFAVEFNWNPVYSYPKLPADRADIPDYWRVMATPVPPEQGLPRLRDIRVDRLRLRNTNAALKLEGYPDAPLEGIAFNACDLAADAPGHARHVRQVSFSACNLTPGLKCIDAEIIQA